MQKLKIIFQKRIVPLLTVFMVVLSALVVSAPRAEAAILDYNDYIQSIYVDADKDVVSVNFGFRGYVEVIVNNDWSNTYRVDSGAVIPFDSLVSSGQNFQLRITMFHGDFLSLDNIPRNTSVSISLDCTENLSSYSTPLVSGGIAYYDTQYIYKGTHSVTIGRAPIYGIHTFDSLFSDIPLDTPFCNFLFEFKELAFNSVPTSASVTVKDFSLTMSISSLYRLQQEVGETNEILEAVKAELIEQGTTLDSVLQKLGVIEANQLDILSILRTISSDLYQWSARIWIDLNDGFDSVVEAISDGLSSGLDTLNNNVQNIITGGENGSELESGTNEMEQANDKLNGVVDKFDQANEAKPTVPDDITTLIDPVQIDESVTFITSVFNYEAMGLDVLYPVLGLVAILAVLFYVLFGKAG